MHFSVKITVAGALDGTTNMPAGPYSPAGEDGTIHIHVDGDLGLIDPDLSDDPQAAAVPLLLQSAHVVMSDTGATGDGIDMVDEDGNVALQILDMKSETNGYTDMRRVIPIGYKLRIKGQSFGSPTPSVIRLSIWQITDVDQLAALP